MEVSKNKQVKLDVAVILRDPKIRFGADRERARDDKKVFFLLSLNRRFGTHTNFWVESHWGLMSLGKPGEGLITSAGLSTSCYISLMCVE